MPNHAENNQKNSASTTEGAKSKPQLFFDNRNAEIEEKPLMVQAWWETYWDICSTSKLKDVTNKINHHKQSTNDSKQPSFESRKGKESIHSLKDYVEAELENQSESDPKLTDFSYGSTSISNGSTPRLKG